MAIQRIPLANSLYLAMLAQERQDQERRTLKEQQDLDRRDRNMRDTQDYILRQQDQKLGHQRAMEELALKKRAQLMQERIEQAGLMERRRQQDDAAMQRTLVGQQGRDLDRAQRAEAARQRAEYQRGMLAERGKSRRDRKSRQDVFESQRIALTGIHRNVQAKQRELSAIVSELRGERGILNAAAKADLKIKRGKIQEELRALQRDHQNAMIGFMGQYTPHLLPSQTGMGSGFDDALGDQGGGAEDVPTVDDIYGGM